MSLGWFDVPHPQDRLPDAQNSKIRVENGFGDGSRNANSVNVDDNTFFLRNIEVDLHFLEGNACLNQVKTKREWKTLVSMMYKRKDRKVLPMNIPLAHGPPPGGNVNDDVNFSNDSKFKPTVVPQGSRLTPEQLASMKIGNGFLSKGEKQKFIDILFEFEGANIAFDDSSFLMDGQSC